MNGNRKVKSLRLVRFGDILYDQQKRLIMLCRTCQRHYLSLETFENHLKKCLGVKHIVASIDELQYDEDKREKRLVNGKLEVLIYEPDAVRSDNCSIDWEAELEDPRWYSEDPATTLPIKPKQQSPVNAKENMAKSRTRSQINVEVPQKEKQLKKSPEVPAKRMRHSSPKPSRPILTNQQQSRTRSLDLPTAPVKTKASEAVIKNVVEDLRHLDPAPRVPVPTTTTLTALPMVSIPAPNLPNGNTQQILNKLRACGVEVKRRNTRETVESVEDAAINAKKQQALDIMRKLQSKGIKCTKVNKQV